LPKPKTKTTTTMMMMTMTMTTRKTTPVVQCLTTQFEAVDKLYHKQDAQTEKK